MEVETHGEVTETTTADAVTTADPGSFDITSAVDSIGADLGFGETATDEVVEPVAETTTTEPAETTTETETAPTTPASTAPRTWRPEAAKDWDKLPASVQAEVLKREDDMFKGIESYKADATVGKTMAQVFQPFDALFKQYDVNPAQQVSNLLRAHYTLALGSPAEKMEIFNRMVQDYNLQSPGEAPYVDPQVQALQQELRTLKSSVQGVHQQRENEVRNALATELDAFAKDPANADFDLVAADIAALLQAGQAATLREAYDKAVWLNPAARAKQISRETARVNAEAAKAAQVKADQVRKTTAANVTTRPKFASATTPLGSMDDTLEASLARIKSRG